MDSDTKTKAYSMRLDGMSWDEIADRLHYDRAALVRAVGEPLRRGYIRRKRAKSSQRRHKRHV